MTALDRRLLSDNTSVDDDGSLATCRSGDGNRGGVAGIDGGLGLNGGGENEKREQCSGARWRHGHGYGPSWVHVIHGH